MQGEKMTREQLEETGMTDAELEKKIDELFGVELKIASMPNPELIRRVWFDQVMQRAEGNVYEIKGTGERIGSFGENNPDEHFGKSEG